MPYTQDVFDLVLSTVAPLPLDVYRVYTYLCKLGYVVRRLERRRWPQAGATHRGAAALTEQSEDESMPVDEEASDGRAPIPNLHKPRTSREWWPDVSAHAHWKGANRHQLSHSRRHLASPMCPEPSDEASCKPSVNYEVYSPQKVRGQQKSGVPSFCLAPLGYVDNEEELWSMKANRDDVLSMCVRRLLVDNWFAGRYFLAPNKPRRILWRASRRVSSTFASWRARSCCTVSAE